jgi:hypothetical protein
MGHAGACCIHYPGQVPPHDQRQQMGQHFPQVSLVDPPPPDLLLRPRAGPTAHREQAASEEPPHRPRHQDRRMCEGTRLSLFP